jgi:4-amino-4-deoxy-L-arabinose transferase-like glycosyltransferase
MPSGPSPAPMSASARPTFKPPAIAAIAAVVALAAIVAAAIFLRFYDLASNPGGLYGDEAAEGLDAWRLLHQPGFHADFFVWFTSDGGREALFAYVVAGVFNFAGASVLALRATSAAFGVAGVLAIGHLARRFGTWTGIVAAAWAAGSLWLVCVSRDGMRNMIVPFFGAVALIAILHWAARPGRGAAILAGAVTSLAAMYTYQPLKLLPVLVVVWLLWLRRVDRPTYERLRAGAVPFTVAFLVVAAPMIAVAVTDPTNYFGRVASTSALNPGVEADSNPIVHVLRTVAMFGLTGDPNARHDVAGLPLLPVPLAVVAAAGLVRLWRMRRDPSHALILLALPVFLVAPLVATEGGSPHFLRALGLAAPLGVTIGLGALEIVEQVRRRRDRAASWLAMAAVAVTLAAVAVWSGWAYFSRPVADRYATFSYPIVSLASYAADHPGSAVILDDYSAMDVEFLDAADQVAIYPPGSKVADPAAHPLYLALSRDDLASTLGSSVAARAQPIAWDPAGKPAVWAVTP